MNREEALQWCVDNLERWTDLHYSKRPDGWGIYSFDTSPETFWLEPYKGDADPLGEQDWIEAKISKKPIGKRYHKFKALEDHTVWVDFEKVRSVVVSSKKITAFFSEEETIEISVIDEFTQEVFNAFIEAWEAYTG